MLNIEEYLGNREYEFISNFKGMTFVEVLEELEFSNPLSVDELSNFYQLLKAKFEKELFSDTNFLQTRVISHFYKEDDIHILGLKKYGGCEFCNVTGSCKRYNKTSSFRQLKTSSF